jgi:hypothetical protein
LAHEATRLAGLFELAIAFREDHGTQLHPGASATTTTTVARNATPGSCGRRSRTLCPFEESDDQTDDHSK